MKLNMIYIQRMMTEVGGEISIFDNNDNNVERLHPSHIFQIISLNSILIKR